MSESSLRDALEKRLGLLPEVWYSNGYRIEALPKSELLDLLAMHPAEPVGVSDEAVERLAGKLHGLEHDRLHSRCPGSDECQLWYDAEFRAQWLAAEGRRAAPLMGATPRPTREQISEALFVARQGEEPGVRARWVDLSQDQRDLFRTEADAVLALMGGAGGE